MLYEGPMIDTSAHTACVWEVTSRKVGNVHQYADFADTTYLDFLLSAGAIMPALRNATRARYRLGDTISFAVRSTREAVGANTNLGIVLLLAPLASTPDKAYIIHQ